MLTKERQKATGKGKEEGKISGWSIQLDAVTSGSLC
jgi:hypothetical protein